MAEGAEIEVLKQRALRLFDFLIRVQQVRSKPVRTTDTYVSQGGRVVWLGELPRDAAIRGAYLEVSTSREDSYLVVDRVPRSSSPNLPEDLKPWIRAGSESDPQGEPSLLEETAIWTEEDREAPSRILYLMDHPEIETAFKRWLEDWKVWARFELGRDEVRSLYSTLFQMSEQIAASPEELELVLAVGCLTWRPLNHEEVKRPLLSVPAAIDFDDSTGRLTIRESETSMGPILELDMLDAALWPPEPTKTNELKEQIGNLESSLLDRERVGPLLQRIVYNLDPGGHYLDQDIPAAARSDPSVTFAPVLTLRKRSNQFLVRVFNEIREQLSNSSDVPHGVAQLVAVLDSAKSDEHGSGLAEEGIFLPLAANREQLQIVERVNHRPHTVVQGPPGTGKTHTIANLISHLLAQGKRVLVTAHTDRALHELRAKLPGPLAALCVSAVGRDQSDLADLRVAVNELAGRAQEFDAQREKEKIERLEKDLDQLERERALIHSQLVAAREREVVTHSFGGYSATLAEIAQKHRDGADLFSWLAELSPDLGSQGPPLSDDEATELLDLIRNKMVERDEAEAKKQLPELRRVFDFSKFEELVAREKQALERLAIREEAQNHPAYAALSALTPRAREKVREGIHDLADEANDLASRREPWMSQALNDVYSGRPEIWKHRESEIQRLLNEAKPIIDRLSVTPRVQMPISDVDSMVLQAEAFRIYLAGGGKLKGLFGTPKPVKQAQALLDNVRVDGRRPESVELLGRFLAWFKATRLLEDTERLWPKDVPIPPEDTLSERWGWNQSEVKLLGRVMTLADNLHAEEKRLAKQGIPKPNWADLEGVRRFADLVEGVDAAESAALAKQPFDELLRFLKSVERSQNSSSIIADVITAVESRNLAAYRASYERLDVLHKIRALIRRREELRDLIDRVVPSLASAVSENPGANHWPERLGRLSGAWQWCQLGAWLDEQTTDDAERLQRKADLLETQSRKTLAALTAAKAWEKSVSRLGAYEQQSLKSYALAVKKLGKGKGKYAVHKMGLAQSALDACRSAVPAWVMPIYRIAETLRVARDIFDVVIIDEASQAGLEATFLQYLAPKLVVVGDDKQVSPAGVGLNQQELIDLRKQFLFDFPQAFLWESPQTSLFDLAKIKYGDVITLREHFRCVPEIIGFSNRIAYEPENVALIPLRQYGRDRLDPIKTTYVADGYTRGSSGNRVNPPEAEAVVDAVLKCLADPKYDGRTIGVISLTGKAQASQIEQELYRLLDPREIRARELRCGDAPAFQGSERDVVFLSMVAALDSGFAALTSDLYLQRFNVAASRPKDQLWLFHSLLPSEIPNREDLRLKLLEYCLAVERAPGEEFEEKFGLLPDHTLIPPFESLFEQHLYNRLFQRGYYVNPQWTDYGYTIDLVVVGGQRRLAIECDGDQWHGAEAYERDLNRQRELERCGWTFFRIRASTFYRDPDAALAPLWDLLEDLDIRPRGWAPPSEAVIAETFAHENEVPIEVPVEAEVSVALEKGPIEDSWVSESSTPVPEAANEEDEEFAFGIEERPSLQVEKDQPRPFGLAPYKSWDTKIRLPDPNLSSASDRIEGLISILKVEGPVIAMRAYSLYVESAGMKKVGKQIKRSLNSALTAAMRRGVIIGENPLNEEGNVPLTLRLPDQPKVLPRTIGLRTFHEVPPAEVAALIRRVRETYTFDNQEEICRRVLPAYGFKKVTDRTWQRFVHCWNIAVENP